MSLIEYSYSIYGASLRFTTNSPVMAGASQRVLHHFAGKELNGSTPLAICFTEVHDIAQIPITIPASAPVIFSNGPIIGDVPVRTWAYKLYQNDGRKIADFQNLGLLSIDSEQGQAEGYFINSDGLHPQVWANLFQCVLIELLRREGLYTIHAAALKKGHRGVLIPGMSGRGKTTSCISLIRAGYCCLSDDTPLLRSSGDSVELLPFPQKIDVTAKTIEFFPELRTAGPFIKEGAEKHYFYPEDIYPDGYAGPCSPDLILFPKIIDWPKSYLEPMSKSRALEELLPQGVTVLNKDIARQQFYTFSRLIEQTRPYRLYFGSDVLDLPNLIDPLIDV